MIAGETLGAGPVIDHKPPAVHPDGRKFVVLAVAAALAAALFGLHGLALIAVAVAVWIALLFRDPERVSPLGDGLVLAPVDGLVASIAAAAPPVALGGETGLGEGERLVVSISLSLFDAHVVRMPLGGVVRRVVRGAGAQGDARDDAQQWLIQAPDGVRMGLALSPGRALRRMLSEVVDNDAALAGQRVGLAGFGGLVDVLLPLAAGARVAIGQRVVAGETVLAELGVAASIAGVTR